MTATPGVDRIVIAGGSGFIGQYLAREFRRQGSQVTMIGRENADAAWSDPAAITDLLDGADLLVNLAGKSVNCRYTAANRAEILRSRIDTTRQLGDCLRNCDTPPELWINSSTATIYRHADDRPMTEATGELGDGFSVGIASAWEAAFFAGDLPATRRVAVRMAIVLGDGSALTPLIALTRLGLGGPHLDGPWVSTAARRAAGTFHAFRSRGGSQKFSWVHRADVLGSIRFLRSHPEISGAVNVSSPNPVDDRTVMRTLRELLGIPFGIPAPRWMLELGTAVIRSETELVLKSRWVLPELLTDAGYEFEYPELRPALHDILGSRR